jgi:hypothetical protein
LATYRYARNAPGTFRDPTGNSPAGVVIAWGVFEVVGTAADLLAVASSARHAWTVGRVTTALVVDVGLTAVGLVTPTAGMAGGAKGMKAVVSMVDDAVDLKRAATAGEAAVDASKGAGKAPAREIELTPGKGHKAGGDLSMEDAVDCVRCGGDVIAKDKSTAREIADQAGDGPPVRDPAHKPGEKPHYHPTSDGVERTGGHVLYDD